jgi:hypothetical protein
MLPGGPSKLKAAGPSKKESADADKASSCGGRSRKVSDRAPTPGQAVGGKRAAELVEAGVVDATTFFGESGNMLREKARSARRVTMVAPKSLYSLQARAKWLFGRDGCLRFYHHGVVPIQDPSHFAQVREGDLVVATWNERKVGACEFANLTSTTHATYVAHPLPPPSEPPALGEKAELERRGNKKGRDGDQSGSCAFNASTCYRTEFVEKPHSKREAWWDKARTVLRTERAVPPSTTYGDEFAQKKGDCAKRLPNPCPALNVLKGAMPLHFKTHQNTVFAPPAQKGMDDLVVKTTSLKPGASLAQAGTDEPFVGKSTYGAGYVRHPMPDFKPRTPTSSSRPQTPSRPVHAQMARHKFNGNTEYGDQFLGKADAPLMIHLEAASR